MPEPIAYESLPYLHPLEVVRELGGFDEEGEEDEATQKLTLTQRAARHNTLLNFDARDGFVGDFFLFIKDCITIACTLRPPKPMEKWRFYEP